MQVSMLRYGISLPEDKRHLLFPRQIPYAIGQFTVNEFCHEVAYRNMTEETKRNLSSAATLSINLGSGILAGFAAAILSQVSPLFTCMYVHSIASLTRPPATHASQRTRCSRKLTKGMARKARCPTGSECSLSRPASADYLLGWAPG